MGQLASCDGWWVCKRAMPSPQLSVKDQGKNVQGNPMNTKTTGAREPQDGGCVGWQREESQVGHTGDAEPQRQSRAKC